MIVNKPNFWQRNSIIAYLLLPISILVSLVNQIKNFSIREKFKIKTICIGNIYLGGTGKTSLAIEIFNILNKKFKTVFIKKKYSNQIDEVKLLQKKGSVITYKDRKKALSIAEKKFKIAILDDGLQQKNIHYDLSIVCFNSKNGLGNKFVIPSGPLRENINEIKNYDLIFINGEEENSRLIKDIKKIKKNLNIFESKYMPSNLKNFDLKKKYLIFSCIGNPHEFEKTLIKYKFKIYEKFIFPDHYKLNDRKINEIKKLAKSKKLDILTTEKDFYRLDNNQKKNIKFLKISLKIKNINKLKKIIFKNL